jgi:hypothetical protein
MFHPRRRPATALVATGVVAVAAALLSGGSTAAAAPGVPGCPSSPSYGYTIPAPQGPPSATSLSTGAVGFSILGNDSHLYYVETNIQDSTLQVAPLACFGGGAVDNPPVAEYAAGLALYVQAPTRRLYQNYVTDAVPGGTGWTQVPNALAGGGPAALLGSDGKLHLFVRGTNGALYSASRNVTSGAWTPFQNLGGGMLGTPAVAARPGGGFVVVILAPTGYLYTRSSTAAGAWGAWTRLAGTSAGSPTLTGGFSAGRLDLFVIGTTGGLYQNTYTSNRFGTFKKVDGFPLSTTRLAAAAQPNRMIVYITESGAETITAYTQYIPGAGWSFPYNRAPYSWPDGAPDALAGARADAQSRPAVIAPLR